MSINATVKEVVVNQDGSGRLVLAGEERGQNSLHFDKAPLDVICLNGKHIWGGGGSILIGETIIAYRKGYTKIEFAVPSINGLK